jgi:NADH-quinone oxidoreductase subunit C
MSDKLTSLAARIQEKLADSLTEMKQAYGELTIVVPSEKILETCTRLRDEFAFDQLMDLCGVDYLAYRQEARGEGWTGPRFAVVYHLQSVSDNRRLRVRTFLEQDSPLLDSVVSVWDSANWY